MIPAILASTLRRDVRADLVGDGIWSVLPETAREAPYDAIARAYDAVIGNALYNRAIWGIATMRYREAANRLIERADAGPVLDFGCGSLVFTHHAYAPALDRLILFDRSLGMLRRAGKRAPGGMFVQGDALSSPFGREGFSAAMAWGMLHIFGARSIFLEELAAGVRPGGRVAVSTLVLSGRALGDRMLQMLHRRGEISEPESAAIVTASFAAHFALEHTAQHGSMLFLEGRAK